MKNEYPTQDSVKKIRSEDSMIFHRRINLYRMNLFAEYKIKCSEIK